MVIVAVNLLSKQYYAFKSNTRKLILNYVPVTKVFGNVKNLCSSNKCKTNQKKFYRKKTSAIIDTADQTESKSKSGSTNHLKTASTLLDPESNQL